MQRYDIINWLIEKYGYKSYLEIGVADGECFEKIKGVVRTCVDPAEDAVAWAFHCTSDEYFSKSHRWAAFDIIFIDGDHSWSQVMLDICNSINHLSSGGTIVVHDCNPPTADHAAEKPTVKSDTGDHYLWNGTVWRAWVSMRMTSCVMQCRCVDADWGCGILQKGEQLKPPDLEIDDIPYELFAAHRKEYLNLITVDEFKEIYAG